MLKYKFNFAKISKQFKYFQYSNCLSKYFSERKRVYYKKEIDPSTIIDILNECSLEANVQDDCIRSKYCPLCEKPHNEELTNMNTLVIYKNTSIFHCFRCGNKGNFIRLFKVLSKMTDLSKYRDLVLGRSSGYGSGGNTTEYEDLQSESRKSPSQENKVFTEHSRTQESEMPLNIDTPTPSSSFTPSFSSQSQRDFKISLNNTGLINELYKRNLLLTDKKCASILDYLSTERKLSLETLIFYKVGLSYEKFKSTSYDYINLPCVTYPMFHPTDKNSLLAVERGAIEDSIYDHYKCDKFYLARLKIRAIGKEFKHFQKMEPAGSILWGLFGMDTVPADAEEIVITEGEYDAMAAYQVFYLNLGTKNSCGLSSEWRFFFADASLALLQEI